MVGSVLVATPGSVHDTFIELRLLIIPQHHGLGLGLDLGVRLSLPRVIITSVCFAGGLAIIALRLQPGD